MNLDRAANRRRLIALTLAICVAGPPAGAAELWTFCVATALGGKDVWISDIFPAAVDREELEDGFKSLVERQGSSRVVAQCPQPNEDKVGVVNAQIAAEAFNRKLGAALHAISAQDFSRRR